MASVDFLASLTQVSGGRGGLAPTVWATTTEDDLATITAAGYMTDVVGDNDQTVKGGDWIFISHSAVTNFPTTPPNGLFVVTQAAAVFSLTEKLSA